MKTILLPAIFFLFLQNVSNGKELNPVPALPLLLPGNDSVTICENSGTIKVPVEGIDSLVDWAPVIYSGPKHGIASVHGKSIEYTPAANFSGKDTIKYIVCDTLILTTCDTVSLFVTVNPSPNILTGPNQKICYGDTISIGDSSVPGYTYLWTPNRGLSSYTISDPKASPADTTMYTLTVTNSSTGCAGKDSVLIIVKPVPSAYITEGDTADFCMGQPMSLTASNGARWLWSNGDTTQTITIGSPGIYTVGVTYANGCIDYSGPTQVIVNPLPAANAGPNKSICSGDSVMIGTPSVSGMTYSWSPSAGLNSTTVAQPKAGPLATTSYTLMVTDSATGCKNSDTTIVTVNAPPMVNAGPDKSICKGDSTTIGTPAVVGVTYNWSPATGLSSDTIAQPIASPTVTTTYILTASAGACNKSDTVIVTVLPLPIANAGPDKSLCKGDSTIIGTAAVSGITYSWSPASGLSSTTIAQPTASPSVTTTYTLMVTDTVSGCKNTSMVTITIAPQPVADAGPDSHICLGSSIVIGTPAVLGMTYSWSPATGLSSTTIAQPTASPLLTTTYILTVSNGICNNSDTVIVKVLPLPVANAGIDLTICQGDSVIIGSLAVIGLSYSWSPSAGLSSGTAAQPVASPSVTTTYILTVSNDTCTNTDTVTINVIPLPANAGPDRNICKGDSVIIGTAAVAGTTYSWSPASGLSSANTAQPTASPSVTTTYILTAINGTCSNKDTVIVTVLPVPIANAGPDKSICAGSTTTIGTAPSAGMIYSWSPSIGLNSSTVAQPTASPSNTTLYILTVSNNAGCSSTDSVKVNVNPLPAAYTGPGRYVCEASTVTLGGPAVAGNTYIWSPATGLSSPSSSLTIASPTASTSYTLIETDTATGCSMSNEVQVSFGGGTIFNAFSPNGDGINDFWYIPLLECYPTNSVSIVNRWGSEVWSASDYDNTTVKWDGKNKNGTDLPDDTYFYSIKYNTSEQHGWVLLKR